MLIYFSSTSENTKRFVESLDLPNHRLPLYTREDTYISEEPYLLVFPTYGGGHIKGAVPKQVIKFLNVKQNRENLVGIISVGNTNFGQAYCLGGTIVEQKTGKPNLHKVEIFGTDTDRETVKNLWNKLIGS